jgi:hypothetical protein
MLAPANALIAGCKRSLRLLVVKFGIFSATVNVLPTDTPYIAVPHALFPAPAARGRFEVNDFRLRLVNARRNGTWKRAEGLVHEGERSCVAPSMDFCWR